MPRVEYVAWFDAAAGEVDDLLDALFAAEESVICPQGTGPWLPCDHCSGSGVNPAVPSGGDSADDMDFAGDDGPWAAGEPCAVCAHTAKPGWVQPCVREHGSSATVLDDGAVLGSEDLRTRELLREAIAVASRDPREALEFLRSRLADLDQLEDDLRSHHEG